VEKGKRRQESRRILETERFKQSVRTVKWSQVIKSHSLFCLSQIIISTARLKRVYLILFCKWQVWITGSTGMKMKQSTILLYSQQY